MPPNWDEISFVISSQYRLGAMRCLSEGVATPSQIASDEDVALSQVSRALRELRDQSLVQLLVSEDKQKGRIYDLTDRGREVWQSIEAVDMI